MQIPSLPTDNLYKFLAIAGLVIIIVSVVSPLSKSKQLTLESIDVITQVTIQSIKAKALSEETKTLTEEIRTLRKEIEASSKKVDELSKIIREKPTDKEPESYQKRLSEIKEREKQIDIKQKQIDMKNDQLNIKKMELDKSWAETKGKNNRINYLNKNVDFYFRVGFYGLILGIVLSIVGFVLWYRRVQRYQDAILKQQHKALTERSSDSEAKGENLSNPGEHGPKGDVILEKPNPPN